MAGLPVACLARARAILHGFENEARTAPLPITAKENAEPTLPLFEEHPILHELRRLEPDEMTPLEALRRLSELKKRL